MSPKYVITISNSTNKAQLKSISPNRASGQHIRLTQPAILEVANADTGMAAGEIKAKRAGNALHISLDGNSPQTPDFVIEDFFQQEGSSLIGRAQDGGYYDYMFAQGDTAGSSADLMAQMADGASGTLILHSTSAALALEGVPAAPAGAYLLGALALATVATKSSSSSTGVVAPGVENTTLVVVPTAKVTDDDRVSATEASSTSGITVAGTKGSGTSVVLTIGGVTKVIASDALTTWGTTLTPAELNTLGSDGIYTVTVTQTDAAGNTVKGAKDFVLDRAAPTFTSGVGSVAYAYDPTATVVYKANATDALSGVASYSLSGGGDASHFNIDATTGVVTFKAVPTLTAQDTSGDNIYSITVGATDAAGNQATQDIAITLTAPSTISLSSYGQLIAPVQVEGKWYYYWDLNADGKPSTSAASGEDLMPHTFLNTIFRQNANGVVEGAANAVGAVWNTDNTYRYATINGVKVAVPTYGWAMAPDGVNAVVNSTTLANGTLVSNNATSENATYDDLLAVWDATNGTSTDTSISGVPTGWWSGGFWSATPAAAGGHVILFLPSGSLNPTASDTELRHVALQVL